MRILAIDPGEVHVGMAYGEGADDGSEFDIVKVWEATPLDAVVEVREWLEEEIDYLSVEDYRLYPDKMQAQGFSQLRTVRLIGVFEYLAGEAVKRGSRVTYYEVLAANYKKATLGMLRRLEIPSLAKQEKRGGHAFDAETLAWHTYLKHKGVRGLVPV